MLYSYYWLGIILLPGILFALYAQIKVSNVYSKYRDSISETGKTAAEITRLYLDNAGLSDISITKVKGELTDYYNPKAKVIALSETTYNSTSVSAIGVACHEVGHALQYKAGYLPIKIRNFFIPICNFMNSILWYLIIFGAILYYSNLGATFLLIGVIAFTLSVLLNLVTLPVEYNASKRALRLLLDSTVLNENEVKQAKEVLNAAALTYVAALLISILNLVRFVLAFSRRRD